MSQMFGCMIQGVEQSPAPRTLLWRPIAEQTHIDNVAKAT